jgi:hypothetical protein
VSLDVFHAALVLADFVDHLHEQGALDDVDDPTGLLAELVAEYRELAGSVEPPTTSSR